MVMLLMNMFLKLSTPGSYDPFVLLTETVLYTQGPSPGLPIPVWCAFQGLHREPCYRH